jgi:plastocyanin
MGAKLLPVNQTFQPNLVTVEVGDKVAWKNEDWNLHQIVSPRQTFLSNPAVPTGMNFDSGLLSQGDTFTHVFTRPGGFHYDGGVTGGAKGTIIVVEKDR